MNKRAPFALSNFIQYSAVSLTRAIMWKPPTIDSQQLIDISVNQLFVQPTFKKKASLCNQQKLTRRPSIGQCRENKKLWSAQPHMKDTSLTKVKGFLQRVKERLVEQEMCVI